MTICRGQEPITTTTTTGFAAGTSEQRKRKPHKQTQTQTQTQTNDVWGRKEFWILCCYRGTIGEFGCRLEIGNQ
eukprot:jgi/Psemu1/314608/fgenesh1_kg.1621_\